MKPIQKLICLLLITCSLCLSTTQADTPETTTPRIVGGHVSTPGQWPWMVALVYKGLDHYTGQTCGGSLINPTWVLTAAHCVENETRNTLEVVAHVFDLKNDPGQTFAIKRIVSHLHYHTDTLDNDIALLQLKEPVVETPVLPLLSGTDTLANVRATIIGWGALSESDSDNGIYPELLYEAAIPIVTNSACKRVYGASSISNSQLCAGLNKGGKDSCQGDSGGPLIVRQDGQWRLAGVTSTGTGCARPHFYGIYTRVSSYLSFIKRIMTTNYTALADVNHDAVVDKLDKTQKNSELRAEFQTWVDQCWTSGAECADVNADGAVNQADYQQQKKNIAVEYRRWLSIVWEPETN